MRAIRDPLSQPTPQTVYNTSCLFVVLASEQSDGIARESQDVAWDSDFPSSGVEHKCRCALLAGPSGRELQPRYDPRSGGFCGWHNRRRRSVGRRHEQHCRRERQPLPHRQHDSDLRRAANWHCSLTRSVASQQRQCRSRRDRNRRCGAYACCDKTRSSRHRRECRSHKTDHAERVGW
jgi:hypothetical protein